MNLIDWLLVLSVSVIGTASYVLGVFFAWHAGYRRGFQQGWRRSIRFNSWKINERN